MSSTTSSSSFSPIALGHTLNSRGELGTFVNPYACSCHTCMDYVAGTPEDSLPNLSFLKAIGEASIQEREQEQRPGIGNLISPSTLLGHPTPPPTNRVLFRAPPIQRTSGNAVFDGSSVVPLSRTAASQEEATGLNLPPPPPLTRVERFPMPSLSILTSFPDVDEEDTMDRLRSLRSQLQIQQDELYKDLFTREEIEAADERYEDLGRKIRAIENCMLEFGAIFRTR